ncbi:hypothetical protein [Erythrobacter sp. MTPC3]|uniref:hypothetical protein n=1 Tax=Erythrobacter sp. MTPC3 TaxID=3056564 RepID=UPI0036F2EE19
MKSLAVCLTAVCCLTLAACGNDPAAGETDTDAADFAARINNGTAASSEPAANAVQAPLAQQSPNVAQPIPPAPAPANAAPGAFAAGTATDPASATCNANRMGPFIGKVADSRTRVDIEDTAGPGAQIRFVRPGGDYIAPNPESPRLNMMLDNQDIIRDARCG